MNHYVVQTQAEAIQAIRLLSDSSKGRANFFVLEALQSIPESARPEIQNPNLIPALSIVDIDEKYGRLCRQLLNNVYILTAGDEEELGNSMPESNIVILSGKGKFSKSRISMAGGSVGLFEGKRIGRAKNLENLAKEIKTLEASINTLKVSIEQEGLKVAALKNSSKKQEIIVLQQEANRLGNELISLKTRQEQYLAFITNSLNRKRIFSWLNIVDFSLTSSARSLYDCCL